ncbi:MAG TPA: flagellar export protein FliJ [Solirubrobacteraceae bacterium]|nr:flagellar export protein FliJ [Solirubrobacteraceae bacterium]
MSGPSFRFSLERVRALRERAEDTAREALAGAIQDHARTQVAMEQAAQAVLEARDAQLQVTSAPVVGAELLARQAYLERSERDHRASLDAVSRSEIRVAQHRHTLTEAARNRQALERLKEHRRSDFEREQARLESIVLDEVALNNFRRRDAA